MATYVYTICGYSHENDLTPAQCPQCNSPASQFKEVDQTAGKNNWADEQRNGVG